MLMGVLDLEVKEFGLVWRVVTLYGTYLKNEFSIIAADVAGSAAL